ncbi:MAG TPA: 2'-5' RNA ligase family protein [Chitinophagaceae bacterium]|jgi:2'-5' RNA ligase|nr:2'-5' RNA ligase family protein [Chitinophagaceae bacterium]
MEFGPLYRMQLYYLALVLPPDLNAPIQEYKLWMQDRFGCTVGLKSPAHITIIPPFKLQRPREAELLTDADALCRPLRPVEVRASGFASFGHRTLFAGVHPGKELAALKKSVEEGFVDLNKYGIRRENRPFHPHITIANRDLPRSAFDEAWQYLKGQTFSATWTAEGLSTLRHNGRHWEVIHQSFFEDRG